MPRSLLLEGILAEEAEAARAQVWAFDHATVFGEMSRRFLLVADRASEKLRLIRYFTGGVPVAGVSKHPPNNPSRHAREDNLILPIGPDEWRAAKLGRIETFRSGLSHRSLRGGASRPLPSG